jgi:hypothetical protein
MKWLIVLLMISFSLNVRADSARVFCDDENSKYKFEIDEKVCLQERKIIKAMDGGYKTGHVFKPENLSPLECYQTIGAIQMDKAKCCEDSTTVLPISCKVKGIKY